MAQNREPPAFQEYAANMMAQLAFRKMSLQDRGLLYTMRLECWVNQRLPKNPHDLAKVLGIPAPEVITSLPIVMYFFMITGEYIICPELENYRIHLAEIREKQSKGGKNGSKKTNEKRKNEKKSEDSSNPTGELDRTRQVHDESLDQSTPEKQSQEQSTGDGDGPELFVSDYEAGEHQFPISNTYANKDD